MSRESNVLNSTIPSSPVSHFTRLQGQLTGKERRAFNCQKGAGVLGVMRCGELLLLLNCQSIH